LPAHRPSRRDEILDAAIAVFAAQGFVDTSISDVAERADVAVTAVYYHFTGKEDLFGAAMRKVLDNISTVVETVRPSAGKSSPDDLSAVIDAVWDWTDANPAQAALVHAQLPGGTLQMSTIRHEFQSRHVQRAFDYVEDDWPSHLRPVARMGVATLNLRTLVDMLVSVQSMRMEEGPLSKMSPKALRREVHRVARDILTPST
jgi:AcrR family transcriptional regulator